MEVSFDLSAPWYIYLNKLKALFEYDNDVTVEAVGWESGTDNLSINISVNGHDKAAAIKQLVKPDVEIGNVKLYINVVDATAETQSAADVAKTAFAGNMGVYSVCAVADKGNYQRTYVVFQPEVTQFYADNLADYRGNQTLLMEDIAKEVLTDTFALYYCTADVREN